MSIFYEIEFAKYILPYRGEYEQAHPIRLYEYQPGRSGSYAEEFLKGFNGILQTDGYTGYQKAPCQAHALCWAHARRYFIEAIPPDLPKGAKASAAVYSIIETAKANGLNPFQYLKYLFEHLPNADIQRHSEHLDDVLPWNEIIQQNCK